MRETVVVYCNDCPIIRMCRDEGRDCDWTRWIHKTVSEAPPMSEEQIRTVAAILGRAVQRLPVAPEAPKRNTNRHRGVGPFQCKVPGCVSSPLKHTGSMWQHLRLTHQITMAEYKEKYGDLVPLTPDEVAELVVEVSCPVCGKVYSNALGHRWPRGALTSHLRGRHGLKADGKTPVRDG